MILFVLVSISIPLTYKFLVPLLTRGGVQFKLQGTWRLFVFGIIMSLLAWGVTWWGMMFLFEAVAGPLYEILKATVKVPAVAEHVQTPVIMVFVLHSVFFALTLIMSKGSLIVARSAGSVWLAAWAPVIVIASLCAIFAYLFKDYAIP